MNQSALAQLSIHAWIQENKIKNEKGEKIDFTNHLFLFDIYRDQSALLTAMKGAQVGFSTLAILKNHFDAKRNKMDIIYTLPTDSDVNIFVGGKVNRIIANNETMIEDVADKDSIEQKRVGESMIYFRGTWSKKAATMVTADRLVHDEKDSSKLDVIFDYQARLQHSKFKQTHTFSHPSLPEVGVHSDWLQSDQKHWFIKCPHCNFQQFLSWNTEDPRKMSIDMDKLQYVCKKCRKILPDWVRANGQWVAKHPGREWSGYWIPLLLSPLTSAADLVKKYRHPDTTLEFFTTKLLGLPYADGASKLLREDFMANITGSKWAPGPEERVVIGIDTGLRLDYVIGNDKGLFHEADCEDYDVLDSYMRRWPKAIAIIDQGGDLIGSRKFHARWPGRVYLLAFGGEKKGMELISWGKSDEHGSVSCDRNRMIQLVIDEFRTKAIPVHGSEEEWFDYWTDWNHLSKMKVIDPDTNQVRGYKWVRNGRDHRALATVAWRVGISRFASPGKIITATNTLKPNSYFIDPDNTVKMHVNDLFFKEDGAEGDWRLD